MGRPLNQIISGLPLERQRRIEKRYQELKQEVESLRELRAGRSQSAVDEKLAALERAARGADNLMPPILDSAAAYATVGEISDTLRRVFGEYREAA